MIKDITTLHNTYVGKNKLSKAQYNTYPLNFGLYKDIFQKSPVSFAGELEQSFFAASSNVPPNKGIMSKSLESVQFNLFEKNANGETIFQVIATNNLSEIMEELSERIDFELSEKAYSKTKLTESLNEQNANGETALHLTNDSTVTSSLLKLGANPFLKDESGKYSFEVNPALLGEYNKLNNTELTQKQLIEYANQKYGNKVSDKSQLKRAQNLGLFDAEPKSAGDTSAQEGEPDKKAGMGVYNSVGDAFAINEVSKNFAVKPINPKAEINSLDDLALNDKTKEQIENELIKPLADYNEKMKRGEKAELAVSNGFLIHGVSGNHKGDIYKAVARQTGTDWISLPVVTTREEMLKMMRQSFPQIRSKFIKTGKPTIVFIDQIEGYLGSRGDNSDPTVSSILALLENTSSKGVILIGSTNKKDAIDKSFFTPKRFGCPIEIKQPETKTRERAFRLALKINDVEDSLTEGEVKKLASLTSGLSVNAIKTVVKKVVKNIDNPTIEDYKKQITIEAMNLGLGKITEEDPTAAYDTEFKRLSIDFPKGFKDVAGMNKLKQELTDIIINPLKPENIEQYKDNTIKMTNGVLLHGEPGNGKTFIAHAIANETGLPMYNLNKATISSSYKDESVKTINRLFEQLEAKFKATGERSLVFMDEIDAIMSKRTEAGSDDKREEINTLLENMSNCSKRGILIIAASNLKDKIDEAALRPGRTDKIIEVPMPDDEAREALFRKTLENKPLTKSLTDSDFKVVVSMTGGFSASAITYLANKALENAVNQKKTDVTIDDLKEVIEKYSVERDMPKASEINKTVAYDTEFKRLSIDSPKGFEDVAGMNVIKKELQRLVIDPLKPENIELFKKNKMNLTNGILLEGPPGNGKTHIIQATANEAGIPMYEINMATIGSSYKNETVKTISRLFEQLKYKYEKTGERSILFLDEMDALLSKRSGSDSTKNEEINTLLQCINNASKNGIMIIGATNLKENIDEAVLRPGRLDKHIYVGNPDDDARKGILELVVKGKDITSNITENDLKTLADITNGFSASAIRYVAEETIRNVITEKGAIGKVSLDDFKKALESYSKGRQIPVANEYNKTSTYDKVIKRLTIGENDPKSLDEVGGMFEAKEKIRKAIILPWRPDIRERVGALKETPPNGVLLCGPPGCGKTFIMKAVACEAGLPIYEINMSNIGSPFIHATSTKLHEIFDQLEEKYKQTGEGSILFIDEIDSIANSRDDASSHQHNQEEINTLLRLMNNVASRGIIVVGATNRPEKIDAAIKRPGRFDTEVYIGLPDAPAIRDMIMKYFKGKAPLQDLYDNSDDIDVLVEAMNGLSNADIRNILGKTVRDSIYTDKETISVEDFMTNINEFKESRFGSSAPTSGGGKTIPLSEILGED